MMKRILGIDYGTRRLGFAISDPMCIIATPLTVVIVTGQADAVRASKRICEEHGAELIVVGLPLNMNGTSGPAVASVEAFVEALSRIHDVPIETWDERLTTSQIERTLLDGDVSRARRKELRDKLAATVILQSYLDSRCGDDT